MKEKIPDRRAMEKMSSDLGRLLEEQDFKTKADLQKYLDGMVKGKKIPDAPARSAVEFAQDIIYEAWGVDSRRERIKLAKEALSISPDCADAYNLLAEDEADSLEEAKDFYQKGVEAGRRALGEEIFKEKDPHFWGYLPTRPYMRSRAGLMECLWELGEHDEAIKHARGMLKLNKNDNQGIRYILIGYLADLQRWDDLEKFMTRSGYNSSAAEWLYTRALLAFVRNGISKKSNAALQIAFRSNAFAPEYLVGKKPVPNELPDSIMVGGEDEGFCYASRSRGAWLKVPGAIEWLKDQAGIKTISKVGRNMLCPCGSGKEFKKCCCMN